MPRHVSDLVHGARRAGSLEGADGIGEAAGGERLLVRCGLWLGREVRARYRATSCAALIAYAEAACDAVEHGADPARLDAAALRALVAGVHPLHLDRAELVAAAVHAAHARARGAAA